MCQSRLASANTDDLKLSIRSSLLLPPRALVYSSNVILFFSVKRAEVIKQLCEHDTTHQEYLLCVYTAPTSSKKKKNKRREELDFSLDSLLLAFPTIILCRVVVACSHGWKIHQKIASFSSHFTPDALHPEPIPAPWKIHRISYSLHCRKKVTLWHREKRSGEREQ